LKAALIFAPITVDRTPVMPTLPLLPSFPRSVNSSRPG
jgi:hypothetical protein